MINNEWRAQFDLLWGIAPPDSLKGKKGEDIKNFIQSQIIDKIIEDIPEPIPVSQGDIENGWKEHYEEYNEATRNIKQQLRDKWSGKEKNA